MRTTPLIAAILLLLLGSRAITDTYSSSGAGAYVRFAAPGTNWYVANSGSDSNPGKSSNSPFLTIAHAIAAASANDTINLHGGDTFSESNLAPTVSLHFTSYGTGQGTIACGLTYAFNLSNTCINVNNINFVATVTTVDNYPAYDPWIITAIFTDHAVHSTGISITSCNFTGGVGAVYIGVQDYTTATEVTNINVSYNNIGSTGGGGICVYNAYTTYFGGGPRAAAFSNAYIGYNSIHDVRTDPSFGSPGNTYGPEGGLVCCLVGANASVAPNFIDHNLVYNLNSQGTGTTATGGIYVQQSDYLTVQYNVVHDLQNNAGNVDNAAYDMDTSSGYTIFQYNYCYNIQGPAIEQYSNDGGARLGDIMRFNVCVNCRTDINNIGKYGVISFQGNDPCAIYGNTIVSGDATINNPSRLTNGGGIGFYYGASAGKQIYNNAVIMTNAVDTIDVVDDPYVAGFMEDYNYYESTPNLFLAQYGSSQYTSLASWKSAIGTDSHSLAASSNTLVDPIQAPLVPATLPQLANYFSPASGSVLIGAGDNLSAIAGPIDAVGNSLVAPYAIGALAYP